MDSGNVTVVDKSMYLENMKKILESLLVGFDCSKPMNISSHSLEDLTVCEDSNAEIDRKTQRMHFATVEFVFC